MQAEGCMHALTRPSGTGQYWPGSPSAPPALLLPPVCAHVYPHSALASFIHNSCWSCVQPPALPSAKAHINTIPVNIHILCKGSVLAHLMYVTFCQASMAGRTSQQEVLPAPDDPSTCSTSPASLSQLTSLLCRSQLGQAAALGGANAPHAQPHRADAAASGAPAIKRPNARAIQGPK